MTVDTMLPAVTSLLALVFAVMLLDQWRERGIGRQALNFALDRAGERIVCDQEALNTIVAGEWTPLPDGYNVSALRQALWAGRAAQGMPVPRTHIRHFTTRDKPWDPEGAEGPADSDLFFRHLDRTRWAGWRPTATPAAARAVTTRPGRRASRSRCTPARRPRWRRRPAW